MTKSITILHDIEVSNDAFNKYSRVKILLRKITTEDCIYVVRVSNIVGKFNLSDANLLAYLPEIGEEDEEEVLEILHFGNTKTYDDKKAPFSMLGKAVNALDLEEPVHVSESTFKDYSKEEFEEEVCDIHHFEWLYPRDGHSGMPVSSVGMAKRYNLPHRAILWAIAKNQWLQGKDFRDSMFWEYRDGDFVRRTSFIYSETANTCLIFLRDAGFKLNTYAWSDLELLNRRA